MSHVPIRDFRKSRDEPCPDPGLPARGLKSSPSFSDVPFAMNSNPLSSLAFSFLLQAQAHAQALADLAAQAPEEEALALASFLAGVSLQAAELAAQAADFAADAQDAEGVLEFALQARDARDALARILSDVLADARPRPSSN